MTDYDAVTPHVLMQCRRIVAVLTHRPYRAFTRQSLARAATTSTYWVTRNHVSQYMPELQRQCIDQNLFLVRPMPELGYRMWVSVQDNLAAYTEAKRDRQLYRRALRDIRKGANLDTLADYGTDADIRVWASLVRSSHRQTVQAFQDRITLADAVAKNSLNAMRAELATLPYV